MPVGAAVSVVLFIGFSGDGLVAVLFERGRGGSRWWGGRLVSVLRLSPVGGAGGFRMRSPLSRAVAEDGSPGGSVGRLFRCGVGF